MLAPCFLSELGLRSRFSFLPDLGGFAAAGPVDSSRITLPAWSLSLGFAQASIFLFFLEHEGCIGYSFADPTVWSDIRLRDSIRRNLRTDARFEGGA